MRSRKKIISFLLIFAYSIGFAQELIPHFHIEDELHNHHVAASVEEHHHLENHKHVLVNDGDDIDHLDHLDDSLYDYFVCLLSGAEHSVCHPSHEVSPPAIECDDADNQSKDINALFTASFNFYLPEFLHLKENFSEREEFNYRNPPSEFFFDRGPPVASC